jgi:Predicted nucleoside-diphosphate sugar epimerases
MINYEQTVFLVTGGTGSFGNFIVHLLLDRGAKEVRVLSRDEKKQYDMRMFYKDHPSLRLIIGDIRNEEVLNEATCGVDVVLQAAALKQVPTCEHHPMEAVRTNVLGADNMIRAALKHAVKTFVAISTDKAVKPVNVMGMTKALQERLVLRANLSSTNNGTRFCCVRYGNVLRSRGSVIPFFRQQIARGEVPTVTDQRMTRFLLTLNDAIDLVIFAVEETQGGETFVRKAPSARIVDIAAALCEEAGRQPEYRVVGTLPGEKFHEILISEEEMPRTENAEDYFVIHPWWQKQRFAVLEREYSSADKVVCLPEIKRLIARADQEFIAKEMHGGEFSKF